VAHQDSVHSRVTCVQCHVGPGAPSFARSKVSGTRRVLAVTFHSYPRPIPAPVQNMRPPRDTCEQCHWPEMLHGDKTRRIVEYADDEKNTESVTTLHVHVGGGSERLGLATGIHWHMNLANDIEYIATDDTRQVIPYVRFTDRSGNVREYVAEGVTTAQVAKGQRRRMDCLDCHNRPSHPIAPTPVRAVDEAMARGEIPRTLPFIHREAIKALKSVFTSQEAASEGISHALRDFYRTNDGQIAVTRRQEVEQAVVGVTAVYQRNVFPEMHVQFGTYPNNIGHIDSPGCFRCHDDSHTAKDGQKIGQDCETCHKIET
jgi:hypothetical protein